MLKKNLFRTGIITIQESTNPPKDTPTDFIIRVFGLTVSFITI